VPQDASPENAIIELSGGYTHGTPITPDNGDTCTSALEAVADLLQEVLMERHYAVWPACAVHGLGLHPRRAEGTAVWHCSGGGAGQAGSRHSTSGHVVARIGALR